MIIVDTHVLVWDALAKNRLSLSAQKTLDSAEHARTLAICDISLWEVALLLQKKRLKTPLPDLEFIETLLQVRQYKVLPITPLIATTSVNLPANVNKDPADRIIVATTLASHAKLITADQNLQASDLLNIIW